MTDFKTMYIGLPPEVLAEIQARWEPKVGDETDNGIITNITKWGDIIIDDGEKRDTGMYAVSELTYLPREGDLIGWLQKSLRSKNIFQATMRMHPYGIDVYQSSKEISFCTDEPLEALLQLWMWLEHGKEWKGGEWG